MTRNLATKYRPQAFDDVVEQSSTTLILKEILKTKKLPACMLFAGPAGCGKTTAARIFASDLNKGPGKYIEIDAASNNKVEFIRDLVRDAKFKSISSAFKVYIIDECHQLTKDSWNAFLKILEEPPQSTLFILCTTDPQKVIPTVLSRCQRYDFKRISHQGIVDRLKEIIVSENEEFCAAAGGDVPGYEVDDEAISYIAKLGKGGMRDAIMLLDKCLTFSSDLKVTDVTGALNLVSYPELIKFCTLCVDRNITEIIEFVTTLFYNGIDLKLFLRDFIEFIVDFISVQTTGSYKYGKIPEYYDAELEKLIGKAKYPNMLEFFRKMYRNIQASPDPKLEIISELMILCKYEILGEA